MRLFVSKLQSCHRLFALAVALCFGSLVAFAQVNLLTNGDFESGTTGWSTSYATTSINNTGNYVIAASPAAAGFSGSSTNNVGAEHGSNALWLNGSTSSSTTVWSETITGLTSNTKYTFYGYLVSADNPLSHAATITINAVSGPNNTTSGAFTATLSWSQIYFTFTTAAGAPGTSATITLVDTNTSNAGNDFGLDNFSVPEPSTYTAGVFLVGAGFYGWRRHRRSLAAKA